MQESAETENNPSQLAAIEDVFRLTPQINENVTSMDSLDSEQIKTGGKHER